MMVNRDDRGGGRAGHTADLLRNWIMVALAILFALLYAAALVGWLKPLGDERMVARLEPIIFVIIGYYFGRAPSRRNENTLKDEISRQTQKADAAQHAKEQAQQSREALEERLKNARVILTAVSPGVGRDVGSERLAGQGASVSEGNLRHSVAAALNILNW